MTARENPKRYRVKCTVYEGCGEEDYYELFAPTLAGAERIAEERRVDSEDYSVDVEIVDRNILGVVLPGSRYAKPGIVYKESAA